MIVQLHRLIVHTAPLTTATNIPLSSSLPGQGVSMKDGGRRTRDFAAFYWRKGVAVMGHTILHTSTILFVLFLSQNDRVIYPKSKSLLFLSIIVIKFSFHLLQFTYFYLHPGVWSVPVPYLSVMNTLNLSFYPRDFYGRHRVLLDQDSLYCA